jgi:hypothetical protein
MNAETETTTEPTTDTPETKRELADDEVRMTDGSIMAVRGLTGMEVALIAKRNAALAGDPDAPAGTAIQIGFVLGNKRVREAELAGVAWLNTHNARDFSMVSDKIEAMSGFGAGAQKS